MLWIIALGISDEPGTKSDEHINKNDEPRTKHILGEYLCIPMYYKNIPMEFIVEFLFIF